MARSVIKGNAVMSAPSSNTITRGTQIQSGTLDSIICNKVGNIVNAGARILSITETEYANGVVFVLPEGYRPKNTSIGIAYIYLTNEQAFPTMCNIFPNGQVTIWFSGTKPVKQVGFAVTFPI